MLTKRFTFVMSLVVCLAQVAVSRAQDTDQSHADESHAAEISAVESESETHSPDDGDDAGHAHADSGEHSGGHDNDPTHSNMSDARWEVVDFRTDIAFFTAVVFALLMAALFFTAWKPIMEGLQKREDNIAANIANAEKASSEAEAKLAEYENKLSMANDEAATIVTNARKDAEAAGQKLVAAAQEDAARLKERAAADIESAKRVALGELADQSTEVAMSVAQRVVGREVKPNDHQSLIQEMLAKLPSKN